MQWIPALNPTRIGRTGSGLPHKPKHLPGFPHRTSAGPLTASPTGVTLYPSNPLLDWANFDSANQRVRRTCEVIVKNGKHGTKTIFFALSLVALLIFPLVVEAQQKPAVKVLIAYHSVGGNTRSMAEAVQTGAQSVKGVDVLLRTVAEATIDEVLSADAIIVGSPVYNANVAPEVQTFINSWPFEGAPLKNRLGAAFVSAGGISAGEETTQLSILRSMLIYGMIVTGGPDWKQAFGASGIVSEKPFRSGKGAVDEQFLAKAEALGRRVAGLARDWNGIADASSGTDD